MIVRSPDAEASNYDGLKQEFLCVATRESDQDYVGTDEESNSVTTTYSEFNEFGMLTKDYYAYDNGGFDSYTVYEYDSKGNLIKDTYFDERLSGELWTACEYNRVDQKKISERWVLVNDSVSEATWEYDSHGNEQKYISKDYTKNRCDTIVETSKEYVQVFTLAQ